MQNQKHAQVNSNPKLTQASMPNFSMTGVHCIVRVGQKMRF